MKKKVLVGALVLACSGSAFADSIDRSGQIYGHAELGAMLSNTGNDSGAFGGLGIGYHLNNDFAAQVTAFGVSNGDNAALAEGIWSIPTQSMVRPYLSLGAGYAKLIQSGEFAMSAGLGVQFDVAPEASIGLGYRLLWNFASPQPTANMISANFNFYFGGANAMPTSRGTVTTMSAQEDEQYSQVKQDKNGTQDQRDAYYQNNYVLPKGISECKDGTTSLTRESIGCYTVSGDKVTMHLDAKFAYDSAALSNNAKQAINSLVVFMKQFSIEKIELEGFASQGQTGEAFQRYNQQLSLRRAEAVRQYLQQQGIDSANITVVGQGWSNPLLPNTSALNRDVNQRVQASIEVPMRSATAN